MIRNDRFELFQAGMPVALLSSLAGPLRLTPQERRNLFTNFVPWAINCGGNAKFLMNVHFEQLFEVPLVQLRKDLGIFPPPNQRWH